MNVNKLKSCFVFFGFVFILFQVEAKPEDYRDYVNEIERSFVVQIRKELGLHASGTLNSLNEKVEVLGIRIVAHRRASLEEARALHILIMEKFLQAINSHEKIQPYLSVQPFSYKQAIVVIEFYGINGTISDESISYMFNVSDLAITSSKNHIVYYSHDPFKCKNVKEIEEPYEEALRINSLSSIDPTIHKGNGYEEEIDSLLASFREEIEEQYQLRVWNFGGKWTHQIENIGATIKLGHFFSQTEARQLLVEIVEKLLSKLNSNEKLKSFYQDYPFHSGLLKLAFHFEPRDYFPEIRLEKLTLENNKVTFIQETILPKEEGKFFRDREREILPIETYDESKKIVEINPHNLCLPLSFYSKIKHWFFNLI